jgi:hypothetical protein
MKEIDMSFYRDDYVVTIAENNVTIDVGSKEEWTHFAIELSNDIVEQISELEPFGTMNAVLPSGDKIEAMWNTREGANQIFLVYKEKMLFGGYESEHIAIERPDLLGEE